MSQPRRYLLISLLTVVVLALAWSFLRSSPPQVPEAIKHGYSAALEKARNGQPGAARVLYQQLGRPDLDDQQRIRLLAVLANYPSPQALKLADADLYHPSAEVRKAAIKSVLGLVPSGQRSLLLGPLLDDHEQSVRFAAVDALLGLSPDDQGLYFGPLQQVIDEYTQVLKTRGDNVEAQYQLARLYLHNADLIKAQQTLEQALRLAPDNLQAVVLQIEVLDKQARAMPPANCWPSSCRHSRIRPTCNMPWGSGCCTMARVSSPCSACPGRWNWSLTTPPTATTWPPPCTANRSWKRRRSNWRKSSSASPTTARRGCC